MNCPYCNRILEQVPDESLWSDYRIGCDYICTTCRREYFDEPRGLLPRPEDLTIEDILD